MIAPFFSWNLLPLKLIYFPLNNYWIRKNKMELFFRDPVLEGVDMPVRHPSRIVFNHIPRGIPGPSGTHHKVGMTRCRTDICPFWREVTDRRHVRWQRPRSSSFMQVGLFAGYAPWKISVTREKTRWKSTRDFLAINGVRPVNNLRDPWTISVTREQSTHR